MKMLYVIGCWKGGHNTTRFLVTVTSGSLNPRHIVQTTRQRRSNISILYHAAQTKGDNSGKQTDSKAIQEVNRPHKDKSRQVISSKSTHTIYHKPHT